MVVICVGPVCIPLHLLLPFLVGLAHQYGLLKWFKPEWVTLRYWAPGLFRGKGKGKGGGAAAPAQAVPGSAAEAAGGAGAAGTGEAGGGGTPSTGQGQGDAHANGGSSESTEVQQAGVDAAKGKHKTT